MEILNEAFIPTRTIHPTTKTILGFRPVRKKRRIWYPHQVHAKNGTLTHRALINSSIQRYAQENNSQDVEGMFPGLLINPNPFGTLGPSNSDPGRKFKNNVRPESWGLRY